MKTRHAAKNMEEAIKLFLEELPDPKRTDVPAVSDRFTIGEKEVLLTAQKTKGSGGFGWRIDHPN